MIKISATGLDKVLDKIESKKNQTKTLIKNELVATIVDIQTDAKQLVQSQSGNTGFLANSIEIDTTKQNEVSIFSKAEYAAYIEFGTRKFAESYVTGLPPDWQSFAAEFKNQKSTRTFAQFVEAIKEWAKKIGGVDDEGAYRIARKIIVNGIEPRPYLKPAVDRNLPELVERLKKYFK